jgi:carbon monoxide dehydrogenase subunit G
VELTNEFSVKSPIDETWAVLTDLERVAPCMPGFQLEEVAGDEYRGTVKVKVGPMIAQYKGVASFRERDQANHRAVVRAEGRETRGQGNAVATVTATLLREGGGTRVILHTDLTITGKVAQFGRGILADVGNKLLRQFVEALEADLLAGAAPAASAPTSSQPVDLLATAGSSVLERAVPLVLVVLLAVVLWLVL